MHSWLRCLGLFVLVFAVVGCGDSKPPPGPPGGTPDAGAPDDALLASLSLSAGSLAPAFSPRATEYTGVVDSPEESLFVTATSDVAGAQLTINGAAVSSGTASQPIALAALVPTLITVEVRTPAGGARTYRIHVVRPRQQAYVKATSAQQRRAFGFGTALSADGDTLAVVTPDVSTTGTVHVYTRSGALWSEEASFQGDGVGHGEGFGHSVALSADGNTLAVGASLDSSDATGINGNASASGADRSGAVYVFTRSGSTWSQQAYVKASNTGTGDEFGYRVALSADGNTLAVGATNEGSGATGIDGDQADNSAMQSGAVYVFTRGGATWSQQAYVKASNTGAGDIFGYSVALAADGNTLAVGAFNEDSSATGINGNQADNSAEVSGAVYVFTRSGSTWSQQAYVKASNAQAQARFGSSLALSSEGTTLAAGAEVMSTGAVYVFTRGGSAWSEQAILRASNAALFAQFGHGVALSADGNLLVAGAPGELSSATGVNGNMALEDAPGSGAAYVFTRSGATWSQQAYVKASNTGASDRFGFSVALSADGSTLAVGATQEASNATGVNGEQSDNSADGRGAAYVFGH